MNFDLRIPIGLLFSILGAILVALGLFGSPELTQRSLGLNMNLWWGLVQIAFGLFMLGSAWRGRKKD